MTSKEIFDANPKAASLIHDYYLNRMLDALEDGTFPPEFKEFAKEKGVPIENIITMLEVNPRQLFDVFDEYNIFIDITPNFDGTFIRSLLVGNESITSSIQKFNTRKEADVAAVIDAITMLEKKLNSLEETNEDS
jgi:hypothetical protein